jgi:hypothetical protein
MPALSVLTRPLLREQDFDSRDRNIRGVLYRQLDMQFGIETPEPPPYGASFEGDWRGYRAFGLVPLAEHGLAGTSADRFAAIVAGNFPFLGDKRDALALILASVTVNDLIRLILEKI